MIPNTIPCDDLIPRFGGSILNQPCHTTIDYPLSIGLFHQLTSISNQPCYTISRKIRALSVVVHQAGFQYLGSENFGFVVYIYIE